MLPELPSLWHHRNNLSVDDNGTLWRKRSSQSALLQLLVPKAGREQLFLSYHASLYGGHLGRTRTLARLADRFYWLGMLDDVKDWLSQYVACIKRKSPVGRHHPLGNIPTGHRWDRITMDILDVCDPTPEGFRYILVIADFCNPYEEYMCGHCGGYTGFKYHTTIWDATGYTQRPGQRIREWTYEITVYSIGMHEDPHGPLPPRVRRND